MTIEIRQIDPRSELGRALVAGSSAEQIKRYGRDGGRSVEDLAQEGVTFVAALLDGEPAGCGAVVRVEPGLGELSRIFVQESARRRGVATAVMGWLEAYAKGRYSRLILETGIAQQESVAFYEALGYRRIPCWGESASNPRSMCYEKLIAG